MNKKWLRTSFRLKPESEIRLKNLCERSGYKQKEILDEVVRGALAMNIFSDEIEKSEKSEKSEESEKSIFPEVYKPWVDLTNAQRKTYEVTSQNIEEIDKIIQVHNYLNRDQVMNMFVFLTSEALCFPLKVERRKLQKIRPKIKRLIGLKKMIEKDILNVLGKDADALTIIRWKSFSDSVEHFEKTFDRWSSDTLFYKNKNQKTQGRSL